ncbi:MAG: hypothetical protein K8W52_37050 [Deltaproteobacteria bacterium]|nr:hypothetical protein [Deltaproteobacteria bacterium]
MLRSRILVDLPSVETDRRMGVFEWLRSLFGATIDLRSGREELTVGACSLVEGLVAAFARAGVTDALSFLVDKRVVYLDANEVPDDLPLILKAAEETGILDRPFREMHLAVAHQDGRLHTIFDCAITSQVALGEAEMVIEVSSRRVDFRVAHGESAQTYAERVKALAGDPAGFEPMRAELDQRIAQVAEALRAALVGAKVTTAPSYVQLIRPGARQIGRFGKLPFGDQVLDPKYRAVPTTQRTGAYADPFYYHYSDPYYDYTNYVIVDAMVHHATWASPHVHVVDPAGTLLFTGDTATTHGADPWIGQDAVGYDPSGNVCVSEALADTSTSTFDAYAPVDSGSPIDTTSGSSCSSTSGSSCSSTSGSSCSSTSGSSCSSSSGSSCSSSSGSSCGSSCSSGSSCGSSS